MEAERRSRPRPLRLAPGQRFAHVVDVPVEVVLHLLRHRLREERRDDAHDAAWREPAFARDPRPPTAVRGGLPRRAIAEPAGHAHFPRVGAELHLHLEPAPPPLVAHDEMPLVLPLDDAVVVRAILGLDAGALAKSVVRVIV